MFANSTVLDDLFRKVSNILIEIEYLQQSLDEHRNTVEISSVKKKHKDCYFMYYVVYVAPVKHNNLKLISQNCDINLLNSILFFRI